MPNAKQYKIDIMIQEGKHLQDKDSKDQAETDFLDKKPKKLLLVKINPSKVNKKVNDKERVAAAMENEDLMKYIKTLIKVPEY